MEQIVLDFYNKEVNSILDMRINIKPEDGWNKDFLTYGQIATYVDTLGLSEGRRTEVYLTLKDFFFNHLDEFQNIILGLPDNVLAEEENKQKALQYLHKLYLNRKKWTLEQRIENYWEQYGHNSYTEQCLQRELEEVENQIKDLLHE